jgi:oligoendopeptidase F
MKCEKIQDKFVDYLDKNLSEQEMSSVENHLKECDDCSQEINHLETLFNEFSKEEIEQPSLNLRMNFEQLLEDEKAKLETPVIQLQPQKEKTDWKASLRIAASILIVISAFLIGKLTNGEEGTIPSKGVSETITLMNNESASKRILAMNNSQEFTEENTEIIQAIVNRLLYDKNTSVRLTAVESLAKFSSLEMVKDALIKSLETEKDPAIQIELIHILVKIQEKRALVPMQNLLENKDVPNYVKKELQINISSLS